MAPSVINRIESYLRQVGVNGSLSQVAEAASGVPQGSVLGPTLFVIYVNDLTNNLTINHLLYADDVKLIAPRKQSDVPQSSLVASSKWPENWELILKPFKSEPLPVGDSSNPATYSLASHTSPYAQPIQTVSSARDLGFLLNTGFSAVDNVARATIKARGVLFYPKRSLAALIPRISLPLYKAFIRPHLEYAIQTSSPILSRDCQALESVQKLAVKFVKGLRRVPCETALQRLQLFSIVRRRIRGDLICMYKIMHGLLNFPCDAVFAAPTRIWLRGHTIKIHQQRCKTRRRQHAFSVRVFPYWNKLPEEIVTATSVETFKFRLDARWQSLFPEVPL